MKLYPYTVDCHPHDISVIVRRYAEGTHGRIWQSVCGLLHCCCYQDWVIILPNGTRLSYYDARQYRLIHIDDNTTDCIQYPRPRLDRNQLPPSDQ